MERDYGAAMRWYRQALKASDPMGEFHPDAWYSIGEMYWDGRGVKQDYREAMRCWRKIEAEAQSVRAKEKIGLSYHLGLGVARDGQEALRWYRDAAELGSSMAIHGIGVLYADGDGVTRDRTIALRYFRQAQKRDRNDPQSMARIWWCLAALGKKEQANREIKLYRARHKPKDSEEAVLGFLVGEVKEADFVADAMKEPGGAARLCQAYFYIASVRSLGGDKRGARAMFKKCVDTGARCFELSSARAELRGLPEADR